MRPASGVAAVLALTAGLAMVPPASVAAVLPAAAAVGVTLPAVLQVSAPFVVGAETVVVVPQGRLLRVDELVAGQNRTRRALPGLHLPLPSGATGVTLQEGAPAHDFRVAGGTVQLAGPVPAGRVARYAFSYTLPGDGEALWLPVAYPTAYLFVLVPHGRWAVRGAGFRFRGTERLGPLALDAYVTVAPTPGAEVPLRIAPSRPWLRPAAVVLAAAACLAMGAGAVRARLRRVRRRVAEERALVEMAARLELEFSGGRLPDSAYLDARDRLWDRLRSLRGG